MSASDAAPLPRLGEVFFDVRGSSRSMRLSWYSDTGVAVFSIWQGGMCTGTFRLPMDELSRMIEILQRGPDRPHAVAAPNYERGPASQGYGDAGYGDAGYGTAGYGDADAPGEHGGGHRDYGPPADEARRHRPADQAAADQRTDDHRAYDYRTGEYSAHGDRAGDYSAADYGAADYGAADYGAADYGGRPDYPTGTYWQEESASDATGQRHAETGEAGLDQQRFVPPYVQAQGESYLNDNQAVRRGHRRGGADRPYQADRQALSSGPDAYQEAQRPYTGIPDDAEYRLPAETEADRRNSAGKHSGPRP